MSSLSRAFTTRRVKASIDLATAARQRQSGQAGTEKENGGVQRSKTTKAGSLSTGRHNISAPLELLHTTNMLSYNAPDIRPRTNSTSDSSSKASDDDLDSPSTAASSPPTSPEVSSQERSMSPEPNHLSCYFMPPGQANKPSAAAEAPVIPHRAPSHTKKASYDAARLTRQRSVSTMSKDSDKSLSSKASGTFSRSSSASTAASSISHASLSPIPKPPALPTVLPGPPVASQAFQQRSDKSEAPISHHPFGRELAQVTEIAEEYGIRDQVADEEERLMKAQGLCKFNAEDYLGEIQGLFASFFPESGRRIQQDYHHHRQNPSHAQQQLPETTMWI